MSSSFDFQAMLPLVVAFSLCGILCVATVFMIRRRWKQMPLGVFEIFVVVIWLMVALAGVYPDAFKTGRDLTPEERQVAADRDAKAKQHQAEYTELAFAKATIQSRMRDPGSTVFGANTTAYSDRKYKGHSAVVVCGSVNS